MHLIILLNVVGFVRTVVFLLAVYFIIKLFTRYVLPLILENKLRQMQQNMNERTRSRNSSNKREGEVTIDHSPHQSNSDNKYDQGEYVDFEEVD